MLRAMLFGFQDDGRLRDRKDLSALDQGRALGARALRLIVARDKLARRGGGYDFSTYDAIVNAARQRGIQPQLVLNNRSGSGMGDPREYARFVAAAGQHFKGRVNRFSLGNEPDLHMAPEKYRQLYVRGRQALKGVDPGATVLFGELSPHNPVRYASRVIGKKGLTAEGFAWHPYQSSNPLAHDASSEGGIGSANSLVKAIHGLRLRTAKGDLPGMYATEFGYQQGGAPGTVSPQQAAAWWPLAIKKAQRAGLRELIAYSLTGDQGNPKWDTGLVDPSGAPRPAYDALLRAARTRGGY
jgi:hypothetical protein